MNFTWDADKNNLNVRKHHIDFGDVADMFNYPMICCIDSRKDYGEERWVGVGFLKGMIAVVVFSEDNQTDTIRIISARKATKYESQKFKDTLPL